MKAIRLHETGGPEKFVVEDTPQPAAGPGEIVVRVRCAALNHRDVFISQGLYPGIALPRTLGSDGAGEVAALGANVAGPPVGTPVVIDPTIGWGNDPEVWSPGATILGMPRDGTFAQYVAVPAENVHAKPAHLAYEAAAAMPLAGLTAYRATFTRGKLKSGESVLITGIGGGVQTFVLLYAKHVGARIAVTSGSDEKLARARALGAEVAVNYATSANWQKEVRAAFGSVDLAIDSAGGDAFAKALGLVRPGGRVVTYGGTSGDATIKMFPLFWNQLSVYGTSMGSPWDFRAMLALFESAALQPAIDRVYAMDEVVEAARRMNQASQFGKIVLAID
ncbi:MAG: zinc-binding dehydrogenase [Vulcanimicrobiaceae bacterium]